jgi:hypothetical protein
MFVCKPCAEKTGWPYLLPLSRGQCELCDQIAVCDDIKRPPPAKPGSLDAIKKERDERRAQPST